MSIVMKENMISGFRDLGLKNGDIVLVHSSLKSFGYVEGGADTVIDALLESVGDEGTIMVPTLRGKPTDSKENPPVFDVRHTPCWTGRIPETFRLRKEAIRSLHPTHSVAAIGAKKIILTEGNENSKSPCDENSPYYKNALLKGYIMLIGVDQESNTSIHSCEEIAGVPYHLQKEITEAYVIGYKGERIAVKNRLHDWNKPPTDFNKLDRIFYEKGIMRIGKIGNSIIRLIEADKMFEITIELLRRQPYFLVKNNG